MVEKRYLFDDERVGIFKCFWW